MGFIADFIQVGWKHTARERAEGIVEYQLVLLDFEAHSNVEKKSWRVVANVMIEDDGQLTVKFACPNGRNTPPSTMKSDVIINDLNIRFYAEKLEELIDGTPFCLWDYCLYFRYAYFNDEHSSELSVWGNPPVSNKNDIHDHSAM